MAQLAVGAFRVVHKASNGRVISESQSVDHSILDNVASPMVFFNAGGTSNDRVISFPAWINGPRGEYVELQLLHSAAATAIDTSACTLDWQVRYKYRNERGVIVEAIKPLRIGDRMTLADSGTIIDQRGWPDDKVNVANVWSPVLRIAPPRSENYLLWDYARFVLDGS